MAVIRFCDMVEKVTAFAIGTLVLGVTLICLVAVGSRYLVNLPFPWTEQVCRIGLVWIIFLGAAVIYRQKRHVSVDLLMALVGKKRVPLVLKIVEAFNAVFFVVMLVFGAKLTFDNWAQTYGALGISVATYYSAAPVGAALMILFQLERVVRRDWSPSQTIQSSF